jgi:DegV family protein with EDD domain
MSGLTIVTDSSAYLPENLTQELGIEVIPLQVIWNGESYYDGVDIKATEFYKRLKTADELPTTSAVSVHQFQEKIDELLSKDREVLILPISQGISASHANAVLASNCFEGRPVEVVDTRLVSMALGFMALTAARAARDGASLKEVADLARKTYSHIGVYFTVDDLKYLHKGGRIGGAKRLLGSALKIKPLLQIQDGKIEAVGSAVTRKKALERLVKLVEEGVGTATPVHISVFHALDLDTAHQLQEICNQKFHPVENILSEVSPVVGSHVGPGTVSIAYMAGM